MYGDFKLQYNGAQDEKPFIEKPLMQVNAGMFVWRGCNTEAADSEVNGASHVNEAFIPVETEMHSALLQQIPHPVCSAYKHE